MVPIRLQTVTPQHVGVDQFARFSLVKLVGPSPAVCGRYEKILPHGSGASRSNYQRCRAGSRFLWIVTGYRLAWGNTETVRTILLHVRTTTSIESSRVEANARISGALTWRKSGPQRSVTFTSRFVPANAPPAYSCRSPALPTRTRCGLTSPTTEALAGLSRGRPSV